MEQVFQVTALCLVGALLAVVVLGILKRSGTLDHMLESLNR